MHPNTKNAISTKNLGRLQKREVDALQTEVDALKRLQAETTADPPPLHFDATRLDALLPAVLDRACKGEL